MAEYKGWGSARLTKCNSREGPNSGTNSGSRDVKGLLQTQYPKIQPGQVWSDTISACRIYNFMAYWSLLLDSGLHVKKAKIKLLQKKVSGFGFKVKRCPGCVHESFKGVFMKASRGSEARWSTGLVQVCPTEQMFNIMQSSMFNVAAGKFKSRWRQVGVARFNTKVDKSILTKRATTCFHWALGRKDKMEIHREEGTRLKFLQKCRWFEYKLTVKFVKLVLHSRLKRHQSGQAGG